MKYTKLGRHIDGIYFVKVGAFETENLALLASKELKFNKVPFRIIPATRRNFPKYVLYAAKHKMKRLDYQKLN